LREGCSCYACTDHHRAFLKHLLAAKEMLGWVLLQIHNYHVLDAFFADIRASINAGTFEADVEKFSRCYDADFPAKTGQGPR
jgi:queuine tRNA-ribosyltransferase